MIRYITVCLILLIFTSSFLASEYFDDYMKRNACLYPWEQDTTYLNKDSLWTEFYLTKAAAYTNTNQDSALFYLKLSEKKIDKAELDCLKPDLYFKYGNFYFFIDKQEEAINYFNISLKHSEKYEDSLTASMCFTNLALIYSYQSKDEKFLKASKNAIKYNKAVNKHMSNIKIWSALADYYAAQKDTSLALEAAQMSLQSAEDSDNFVWIPWAQNQYALLLLDFGNITKSDSIVSTLIPIADTIYYKKLAKEIYKTKAVISNLQHDGKNAIKFLDKAKQMAKMSCSFDSLDFELNYADAYANNQNYEIAIEKYKNVLVAHSNIFELGLKLKTIDKLISLLKSTKKYKDLAFVFERRKNLYEEYMHNQNLDLRKKYEVELHLQDHEIETKDALLEANKEEQKARYFALGFIAFLFIAIAFAIRLRISKKQYALELENLKLQKMIDYNKQESILKQKESELFEQTKTLAEKQDIIAKLEKEVENNKALNLPTYSMEQIIKEIQINNMNLESFDLKFNEIHPDFYTKMHQATPELSQAEIRISAFIKLNMNTKEIASLLNVSPSTVDNHRFKVRKKLGLAKGENLFEAIQNIEIS